MKHFRADSRCFNARSILVHSEASITRGTMSIGQARSVPWPSWYTVNVMPSARLSTSARLCRCCGSSMSSERRRSTSAAAAGRGAPSPSTSSSHTAGGVRTAAIGARTLHDRRRRPDFEFVAVRLTETVSAHGQGFCAGSSVVRVSPGLRFQVMMIPGVPGRQYLDRFLHVEALGFEVAGLPDHFCDWANPTNPWLEAWTSLAAVAARTSILRLATYVSQIPLRTPAILANQAVTADQISNGRVELGLGTGLTIEPSYEMAGLPNWTTGQRVARFGEYIELVGKLLAGG